MTAAPAVVREDVSIAVSGQGGDGSLTVSTLLGTLLRRRRLHIYTERDVLSRIKGGVACAAIRASVAPRRSLGDRLDLLVAFDEDGVRHSAARIGDGGVLIFDSSDGDLADPELIPRGARVISIPFGRLAVRHLGRILYKNSIAVAFASRVLGLPDDDVREAFREEFRRLGQSIVASNLEALELGFELASGAGLGAGAAPHSVGRGDLDECLLLTGNEAVGLGFIVAGGRFFAGYPITPATEIMSWLERSLPRFGGVVWQAEDELAAVNMALGAALTGVRAMTATSGPGIALMQEGISQAGSAEIPLVVVNAQRGGPSTGLPTKTEQADLDMMVFGGNGEFPRVVLAPASVEDCFELTVQACNLAERYQMPVYLALDQALAQNTASSHPFDLEGVTLDRGPRVDAASLRAIESYGRYAVTEDGVSPYTVPGTAGGLSLVTGNERNEFGLVSAAPANRRLMVEKRARKLESARADLPPGRLAGPADAPVGVIATGGAAAATEEAAGRLLARGVPVRMLQPRTLWPVTDETLDFIESCDRVYVVEQNATGQLAKLLIREGADRNRVRSMLRYDGQPLAPGDLEAELADREAAP